MQTITLYPAKIFAGILAGFLSLFMDNLLPLFITVTVFEFVDFITGVIKSAVVAKRTKQRFAFESVKAWRTIYKVVFILIGIVLAATKRGVYTAGQRTVTEDKHTNIVRNFGTDYYFDIEMDRTFDLAQDGGLAEYNAMGTIANKGYFNLIGDTPLSLEEGDMVSFRGSFAFGEIPTIS